MGQGAGNYGNNKGEGRDSGPVFFWVSVSIAAIFAIEITGMDIDLDIGYAIFPLLYYRSSSYNYYYAGG